MGIKVYAEKDFKGQEKDLGESMIDLRLAHIGVKFDIKSAAVSGNPWIVYSQDRYKGFLACLEEGLYPNLNNLQGSIVSMKCKDIKKTVPHAILFNPSSFKDNSQWWSIQSPEIISIAIGGAGLWAIDTKNQVHFRKGTGYEKGFEGRDWILVPGSIKQISVGDNVIWGVSTENQILVRTQLSESNPLGSDWVPLGNDGGELKMCSVGPGGSSWAINSKNKILYRAGAKSSNPIGTKWQEISGQLIHISVGKAGVWGITPEHQVLYRDGTYGLSQDSESSAWTKVDGQMIWISSGDDIVWAVSASGAIWYRAGINSSMPFGSNWFKINLENQHSQQWTQIESHGRSLIGVTADKTIIGNDYVTANDLLNGKYANIYEESDCFSSFNLNPFPSSSEILSGAWIIYSDNNFTGTCMYHFDDEVISNDPNVDGEDFLKSWETPIGSLRQIHGGNYNHHQVVVSVDWENVNISSEWFTLKTLEDENTTEEFTNPIWNKIEVVNAQVEHRFQLSDGSLAPKYQVFSLDNVPKVNFSYTDESGKIDSKLDFRQELGGRFTFDMNGLAERTRSRTENIRLPPTLPPQTRLKVSIICQRLIISATFTALFTSGGKSWSISGEYRGKDDTNLKLKMEDTIFV
ncbi:uncharacterized protein LOC111701974 [Eurytemora carolleeae]|uniref:uncharacterized protein LOC111701974 n=1 Tax=Eurytemora carolleeae TaxID=1294199 RepID=UPI000C78593E|nr:uncharacterized protein LOC111701974 [Eurytemora carolleeae]|eukprot:XP_023329251.1 uncharacterized protein LOC111701974 [Eurytemora affinis]